MGQWIVLGLVGSLLAGVAIGGCESTRADASVPEPATGSVASALTPAIASWSSVVPSTPPARLFHALAYDGTRKNTVLFGGYVSAAFPSSLNDTWTFDGTTWTPHTPAAAPNQRGFMPMVYDADRKVVVLFAGIDLNQDTPADTWTWDGTNWAIQSPAHAPPGRFRHAMAYDAARKRTVMFGGLNSANNATADTWTWDGTDWTEETPATSPPAREDHAMAYDAARGVVVLFGGFSPAKSNDMWTWNGTTWKNVTPAPPAVSPSARAGAGLAYDATRSELVLFGGSGNAAATINGSNDTWIWNGAAWAQASTTGALPPVRESHALAFDETRKRVVMFGGGNVNNTSSRLNDTWLYSTRAGDCTTDAMCTSGHCVDGACCEVAACGTCQACAPATGTCGPVKSAKDPDTCTGVMTCDAAGACVADPTAPVQPGTSGSSGSSGSSGDSGASGSTGASTQPGDGGCASTPGPARGPGGIALVTLGVVALAAIRRRRRGAYSNPTRVDSSWYAPSRM